MKTYHRLAAKLFAEPLMLRAPERQAFETELLSRMSESVALPVATIVAPAAGHHPATRFEAIGTREDPYAVQRVERVYQRVGNVAIVKIHGVIDKVISQFEMDCYGGVDLQDIDMALQVAAADERVSHVVLNINSPGGSVVGLKETAARIAAMRATKEIHTYVPGLCCSAGYYLGSQADVIAAGDSAIVGSIGVYLAVLDASRWYEKEGLNMQVLQAGSLKTMGANWRPLSDDEKAHLQAGVDARYAEFKAAVTSLRAVPDSAMQGQWMTAAEAKPLNLVDVLTGDTLDEYVGKLIAN